jgi:cysteine desulfurase
VGHVETPVYLDYAATTPLDPVVREAMLPYLGERFGNPSSVHSFGQTVRRALDRARDAVAASVGADSSEIYFTSGGTEANNTALLGVLLAAREQGRTHLVTSVVEHHAVLDTAIFAQSLGFTVTFLPADAQGFVSRETLAEAITDKTALVSLMQVNNEIGTVHDIAAIATLCHDRGTLFHTDAVQSFSQMPFHVKQLGVDLATMSGHKIYGPKGVGALYVRRGIKFSSYLHGGMQEREKRAGTENVPAIVGLGKAVELLPMWREETSQRARKLRDMLYREIQERIPTAILNGPALDSDWRAPNNLNLSFPGIDGETLLLSLDMKGVAVSSGSACASGSIEPSHVLLALGIPLEVAHASVRFSIGRATTHDEILYVAEAVASLF